MTDRPRTLRTRRPFSAAAFSVIHFGSFRSLQHRSLYLYPYFIELNAKLDYIAHPIQPSPQCPSQWSLGQYSVPLVVAESTAH